jgi:uncharacterized protein with NAD-binding domain and iron-sulfur cluster
VIDTSDVKCPTFTNPLPDVEPIHAEVGFSGSGWSMDYLTSADDGLVLTNVTLSARAMARQMSLPYLTLQTSKFGKQRIELKQDNHTDPVARSRLIEFEAKSQPAITTVSAAYLIYRLPNRSASCLVVEQEYRFEGTNLSIPCEPTESFPCARFPGFYRHLPDTMRRIPVAGNSGGAADNLVAAERVLVAQAGGRNELISAAHAPGSFDDLALVTSFVVDWATRLGIPPHEHVLLMERLLTLLTSCDERRYGQWEHQSWWDYTGAERRSVAFQKFLADGLTRTLVAARAREMSARTGGGILLQILFDLTRAGGRADRLLNAPTNDAWITPWVEHLRGQGVELRLSSPVLGIDFGMGRIQGLTVEHTGGGSRVVRADHYVAALPVEQLRLLVTPEMRRADPALGRLDRLVTRWMNGIMFYLDTDVPVSAGHAIYIDSEWALTSVSQAQFWKDVKLTNFGDGRVEGILSVDVSEWERPSRRTGKVAAKSTPEEIRDEVWAQLKDHLNDSPTPVLDNANVLTWFLDPAIEFPNPTGATNLEPLLVNTAGSWQDRPEAHTRIPNLVVASDFVRTHTDLATMEGANEAARRAVNAILDRTGSRASRCPVWKLREPAVFAPARALDRVRWKLFRRPPRPPLRVTPAGDLEATGPLATVLVRWLPRLVRPNRG